MVRSRSKTVQLDGSYSILGSQEEERGFDVTTNGLPSPLPAHIRKRVVILANRNCSSSMNRLLSYLIRFVLAIPFCHLFLDHSWAMPRTKKGSLTLDRILTAERSPRTSPYQKSGNAIQ